MWTINLGQSKQTITNAVLDAYHKIVDSKTVKEQKTEVHRFAVRDEIIAKRLTPIHVVTSDAAPQLVETTTERKTIYENYVCLFERYKTVTPIFGTSRSNVEYSDWELVRKWPAKQSI